MKLVSVIVPIYNKEETIKMAVDSLLNQTYKNIEIILVDDGSEDNTKEIIKTYKDKRIKYYYKNNGGVSSARNFGINKSIGDFIYFMDADDEIVENGIEILVNYILKYDCDFVRTNYYLSIRSNSKIQFGKKSEFKLVLNKDKYIKKIINGDIPTFMGIILVKKEFLDKYKINFDENIKYMEDKIFYFKLFLNAKNFYLSNDYIYKYYYQQFTNKNPSFYFMYVNNLNIVYNKLLELCNNNKIKEYIKNQAFLQLNYMMFNLVEKNAIKNYKDLEIQYKKCDLKFIQKIKYFLDNNLYSKICIFLINNNNYKYLFKLYEIRKNKISSKS